MPNFGRIGSFLHFPGLWSPPKVVRSNITLSNMAIQGVVGRYGKCVNTMRIQASCSPSKLSGIVLHSMKSEDGFYCSNHPMYTSSLDLQGPVMPTHLWPEGLIVTCINLPCTLDCLSDTAFLAANQRGRNDKKTGKVWISASQNLSISLVSYHSLHWRRF